MRTEEFERGCFNVENRPRISDITDQQRHEAEQRLVDLINETHNELGFREEINMDFFAKRIAYLKKTYGLENGLQIHGLEPTKETTLEEVSERYRQSQEKGYSETFAAQTTHKGKRFGLAIVIK